MNAKRRAASLLLGVVLAACAGNPTAPTPAGSPGALSPTPITASGPTSAPSAATIPTPQATPSPARTPSAASPPPKPTTAPVPPMPTGATFHEDVECLETDCNEARTTQTVTWRTPPTKGVTIRAYGVTECLARPAHPEPGASGPCLVTRTRLPASVRTLLATAPASAGKVSWSWTQETGCDVSLGSDPDGPQIEAVVLAAYNASGQSIFTIAEPGQWRELLPGEVSC